MCCLRISTLHQSQVQGLSDVLQYTVQSQTVQEGMQTETGTAEKSAGASTMEVPDLQVHLLSDLWTRAFQRKKSVQALGSQSTLDLCGMSAEGFA